MAGRLDGRAAVVTGAARGIGRATAEVYAREGARVLVVDRDADAAEAAAREIGARRDGLRLRRHVRADVQAMAAAAVERFGGIDILTQNAGIYPNTPVDDITDDEWALVMNVNTRSALYTVAGLPAAPEEVAARADHDHVVDHRAEGRLPGLRRTTARRRRR